MKKLILVWAIMAFSVGIHAQTDSLRRTMPNNGDVNKTGQGTLPSNGYNNGNNNGGMPNNLEVTPKSVYGEPMPSDTLPNGTRRDAMNNKMRSDTLPNVRYDKRGNANKMGDMKRSNMRNDTLPDGTKRPKMTNKMDENMGGMMHTMDHKMMMKSGEKHVMMENGKVIIMRNGITKTVQNYTPLRGGTRVMSDGTIMKKDGTKTMLQEGECLNMAGDLVPMTKQGIQ